MPVQPTAARPLEMPPQAGIETSESASCVNIITRGKNEAAQPADPDFPFIRQAKAKEINSLSPTIYGTAPRAR